MWGRTTRSYWTMSSILVFDKRGPLERDIKPDNLLLDKFGHMKLSDFGLCKPLDCTNLQEKDFSGANNLSGALQSDGRPAVRKRSQQEQLQHWQRNRRMLVSYFYAFIIRKAKESNLY